MANKERYHEYLARLERERTQAANRVLLARRTRNEPFITLALFSVLVVGLPLMVVGYCHHALNAFTLALLLIGAVNSVLGWLKDRRDLRALRRTVASYDAPTTGTRS